MTDLGKLLARVMFSLIFVAAGAHKILTFAVTSTMMADKGIPMADVLLIVAIIMELGGGLMILFGFRARLGAFMIFLFIIPVTFVFHSFWMFDGSESVVQMQQLLKNLAMMGGALYIMVVGSGKLSLDKGK